MRSKYCYMTAIKSDIVLISLICQSKPTFLYEFWHERGKEEANLKENEIKAFLKGQTSREEGKMLWIFIEKTAQTHRA